MAAAGTPTLDQLKVFLAVVEAGSFSGGARALGRTTSVVSYTIANLEGLLGFALFTRDATRRPVLTAQGLTVLGEARSVTNGVNRLRAKAQGLLEGLEASLTVVLDAKPVTDATQPAPLRQIRNTRVQGDELLEAVTFLADALKLPALRPATPVVEAITARFAVVLPLPRRA